MPDWFAPGPRMEQVFRTTLDGMHVVQSLRLDRGAYAKHGTSVAVRIYVIDKVPGSLSCVTINRATPVELLDMISSVPPRSLIAPVDRASLPRAGKLSLFRSVKSATSRPAIVRTPQRNEVADVTYIVLDDPAPAGEQQGVYSSYRPSRLVFTDAGEHPTMLVESAAMASIHAPKPSYVPRLPEQIVAKRLLSAAQLETVVYAGDAWSRELPGRYVVDPKSVQLTETADGDSYRYGFFLGDGTGAGKGRQAAACIMDQWLRGNRAISGSPKMRLCLEMRAVTGQHLAGSPPISSSCQPGKSTSPSQRPKGYYSCPMEPCDRPGSMTPDSTRSLHGRETTLTV